MSAQFHGRNGFAGSWWFSKSTDRLHYMITHACIQDVVRGFVPMIQIAVMDDFGDLVKVPL